MGIMKYLNLCVLVWFYIAFAFEDILERKFIAVSSIARRALATGFSSWARDRASLTRQELEDCEPCIEDFVSGLSFVIQVYI